MNPIFNISIPVKQEKVINTEEKHGLKYAAVFRLHTDSQCVIALFDSTYWAHEFVKASELEDLLTIIDVTTGNTV